MIEALRRYRGVVSLAPDASRLPPPHHLYPKVLKVEETGSRIASTDSQVDNNRPRSSNSSSSTSSSDGDDDDDGLFFRQMRQPLAPWQTPPSSSSLPPPPRIWQGSADANMNLPCDECRNSKCYTGIESIANAVSGEHKMPRLAKIMGYQRYAQALTGHRR